MLNLPPELIPLILPDRRALVTLALVNKYYNNIVTPNLYERITVQANDAIKQLSNTLATGRPILRKYPVFLDIGHSLTWGDVDYPYFLVPDIKRILMHVPNLSCLYLKTGQITTPRILEEPRFPFKLRRLEMRLVMPTDIKFFEFLKTQPEIEEVYFRGSYGPDEYKDEINTPFLIDVLPKLRSIESDRVNIMHLVPYRRVTSVQVLGCQWDLDVQKAVSKSLAPLESFGDYIGLRDLPWESGIVSRWFPSLGFCSDSLRQCKVRVNGVPSQFAITNYSVHSALEERGSPSCGLDVLRNGLSMFSVLRKFSLDSNLFGDYPLTPEFCAAVPELSRFDLWQESCPSLDEVEIFGVTLRKA